MTAVRQDIDKYPPMMDCGQSVRQAHHDNKMVRWTKNRKQRVTILPVDLLFSSQHLSDYETLKNFFSSYLPRVVAPHVVNWESLSMSVGNEIQAVSAYPVYIYIAEW